MGASVFLLQVLREQKCATAKRLKASVGHTRACGAHARVDAAFRACWPTTSLRWTPQTHGELARVNSPHVCDCRRLVVHAKEELVFPACCLLYIFVGCLACHCVHVRISKPSSRLLGMSFFAQSSFHNTL
jgi:hypothetical protein